MFKRLLYKFGQLLANHLPIKISYTIANVICDFQYLFSFKDRCTVKNNLDKILGEGKYNPQIIREMFRNFGRYLVEFFKMEKMVDSKFIQKMVRVNGLHYVDKVLEKGRGCIVLTAHIGNWELGAVLLSKLGYPLVVVALPHNERPVNNFFNQQREMHGNIVVPTKMAIRKCSEALIKNKLVGLVADRVFSSKGTVVDFFGHQALLPKGPAMFSFKLGAPIIPVFLIRQKDGTFILTFKEPIDPPRNKENIEEEEGVLNLIRQYTHVIEQEIRKYPEQWLMFRDFSTGRPSLNTTPGSKECSSSRKAG